MNPIKNQESKIQNSVHRYYKIYKPTGYLSQFVNNQNRRRNKKLLSELGEFHEGTMSVGRLDEKSEGLLFLTTDGRASNEVCSNQVEKEYNVQVEGEITSEALAALANGVEISLKRKKHMTLPAVVRRLDPAPHVTESSRAERDAHKVTSWVSIIITEGKYRQVRKMTAAVGFPTLRLIRVRIGNEFLEEMRPGDVVELEKFKL